MGNESSTSEGSGTGENSSGNNTMSNYCHTAGYVAGRDNGSYEGGHEFYADAINVAMCAVTGNMQSYADGVEDGYYSNHDHISAPKGVGVSAGDVMQNHTHYPSGNCGEEFNGSHFSQSIPGIIPKASSQNNALSIPNNILELLEKAKQSKEYLKNKYFTEWEEIKHNLPVPTEEQLKSLPIVHYKKKIMLPVYILHRGDSDHGIQYGYETSDYVPAYSITIKKLKNNSTGKYYYDYQYIDMICGVPDSCCAGSILEGVPVP